MLPETEPEAKVYAELTELDARIARAVAQARCVRCEGPLHVANYQRKPRGGLLASAGEAFTLRHSLCCGRRGCRKRTLPPSLRFLGRRVYLELVVVFASACAQAAAMVREARETTGVPERTLKRWLQWWREQVREQGWWVQLRARFVPPPPDESQLPRSLLEKLSAQFSAGGDLHLAIARCLAPGTTRASIDVARFVRDAEGSAAAG